MFHASALSLYIFRFSFCSLNQPHPSWFSHGIQFDVLSNQIGCGVRQIKTDFVALACHIRRMFTMMHVPNEHFFIFRFHAFVHITKISFEFINFARNSSIKIRLNIYLLAEKLHKIDRPGVSAQNIPPKGHDPFPSSMNPIPNRSPPQQTQSQTNSISKSLFVRLYLLCTVCIDFSIGVLWFNARHSIAQNGRFENNEWKGQR